MNGLIYRDNKINCYSIVLYKIYFIKKININYYSSLRNCLPCSVYITMSIDAEKTR